jgi:hypothetical protein
MDLYTMVKLTHYGVRSMREHGATHADSRWATAHPVGWNPRPALVRTFWLLSRFGEVERAGATTKKMENYLLSPDAAFPPLLWAGKWCKTAKRPHFTKCGQEPTFFTPVGSEANLI